MAPSPKIDELCYPYIYEASLRCDFEIHTDQMCRLVGEILADLPGEFEGLRLELEQLQPLIYHLNGSIRGDLAIEEADVQWLLACYRAHRETVRDRISGFVLPRGPRPVGALNRASSASKIAIRWLMRLQREEGIEVPKILLRFCNVMCNYFFVATLVINQHYGVEEIPFVSKSYR